MLPVLGGAVLDQEEEMSEEEMSEEEMSGEEMSEEQDRAAAESWLYRDTPEMNEFRYGLGSQSPAFAIAGYLAGLTAARAQTAELVEALREAADALNAIRHPTNNEFNECPLCAVIGKARAALAKVTK